MLKNRNLLMVLIAFVLIGSGTVLLAHGDDEEKPGDPASIDIELDFVPTYYKDVKPIIAENCMACHAEGQIASDVSLADGDILDIYEDVAYLTNTRYMPPWMPSSNSLPMQHDRSLSDYEIAVIQAWAEADTPMGDEADYVEPQVTYELPDIRADQVLQLDDPYLPEDGVVDDYRCFAFEANIDEPAFLTGYEFVPDVTEQVHHGIVYRVEGSTAQQIERLNYADGRVGWSCYTGTMLSNTDEEFLATWTPGTFPAQFPQGTGYWIEPDDIFIVQIHYNLIITREPDQTAVTFQYEDTDSDIQRLLTLELSGPVEIPCPAGVTGEQCNRDVAIQRAADLYKDRIIPYRPDGLLDMCGQTIADYALNTGENATTHCDFRSPANLTLLGVLGHMHELGTQFHLELNPDTDEAVTILDIPAWDFHWQDRYQLVEPLQIQRGDTVRMTCQWDNTLSDDPRYVVWGEGTQDEMCFATLMLLEPVRR